MKIFSKIVLFFTVCLFVKNGRADPYIVVASNLDFGTCTVADSSQSYTVRMTNGGVSGSGVTVTGYSIGKITIVNDSSSTLDLYRSYEPEINSTTTLTCQSNCRAGASNCHITFTNRTSRGHKSMNAGASSTYYVTGNLAIPANCGSGNFVGTLEGQLREGSYTSTVIDSKIFSLIINLISPDTPILVSKTQDMNFGQVSSNQSHDVTINPNGCSISSTYPAGIISASGAKCGIFTIKNEGSSAQALTSVTLPSSVTLSGSNGGTMSLDITSYPAVSSITSVPASTTTSVNVGGTLHVINNAPAGTYTGNYTITVNY